jgi:hypothetical protein
MSEGTQIISGSKTFDEPLNITSTSNQLVLGTTNTITLNSVAPASSLIYTLPDVGAASNFIMSEGTQIISGSKSFDEPLNITSTSNQIVLSTSITTAANTLTINTASLSEPKTYTIPDIGSATSSNFVMSNHIGIPGDTRRGISADYNIPLGDCFGLEQVSAIQSGDGAQLRLFSNASNKLSFGHYINEETFFNRATLNNIGDMTLNKVITSGTSNQLVLGTTNTVTINSVAPASSRIYTIPDVSATSANFIMSEGNQTIKGSKTFSDDTNFEGKIATSCSEMVFSACTFVFEGSNTYTVPNTGTLTDANFVMTESAQTINGIKTFSSNVIPSSHLEIPHDTLRGLSSDYDTSTGSTFGIEQASALQTGTTAQLRIFSAYNSDIVFGHYTDETSFVDRCIINKDNKMTITAIDTNNLTMNNLITYGIQEISEPTSDIIIPTSSLLKIIYNTATKTYKLQTTGYTNGTIITIINTSTKDHNFDYTTYIDPIGSNFVLYIKHSVSFIYMTGDAGNGWYLQRWHS